MSSLEVDGGPNWLWAVVAVLGTAVVIALIASAAASSASYSPYNPGWDGASDFRNQVENDPDTEFAFITDGNQYDDQRPDETVVFVVSPDDGYDEGEANHVRQFVVDGGTIVVLENFERNVDDFLRAIGTTARIDGALIRDDINSAETATMPIATVENETLTPRADQVTLNHGTAVEPGNATVLARTSEFAYLVESPDEHLDANDELEAMPVATAEPVGDGRVVVVGDPSVLTNAMLEQSDNEQFVEGLYADESVVLMDVSQTADFPLVIRLIVDLRAAPLTQVVVGLVGIGCIAVLFRRRA